MNRNFESITSQGVAGIHATRDRLSQMQQQWVDLYQSGQVTGAPIDDRQMMEAAYYSQYTPKEWQQVEQQRQSDEQTKVSDFWASQSKTVRQEILESPKEAQPTLNTDETMTKLREIETQKSRPKPLKFDLGNTLRVMLHDIEHWDEMPYETNAEKVEACFFSEGRVGVVLGLTLLFTLAIAIVAVLTL